MSFVSGKRFGFAIFFLFVAIIANGGAHAERAAPRYSAADIVHLPGSTRWDYLTFDPQGHRLFITRGDSVDVFDVMTKKIVGKIVGTEGVHGVALAMGPGHGYTSNGATNTVTVFDLANLQTLTTVPVGTKPDAIVYDPATQRIFTANGESGDLTAIDAVTNKVLATIKLDGKPEFAVVDGTGSLYVNLEDKAQIAVIDTQSLKLATRYDLAPICDGPTGLSIDRETHRLFASCHNQMMIIVDAKSGKITNALPIGAFSDATAFDPSLNLAFSSNSDGTLTIIGASDPSHYTVRETVKTVPTARTMALDPATHILYLSAAEPDGTVAPPTDKISHPHPSMKPDSFMILIVAPDAANPR